MLAERWMSPTALKAAFKTSKRISPKRNPHFSPGRWWHDEKQFIFSTLIGSIYRARGYRLRWARPGLFFSPQRAHAPLTVVTATLFVREHALREKFLRHDHAPR